VTLGSRCATLPTPKREHGRWHPWGRLAAYRRRYDDVVGRLIDEVAADPRLDQRDDVLALLLRSSYEDGTAMSRTDVADELLTLLAAGHETTASTLAWCSSGSAAIPRCWPGWSRRPMGTGRAKRRECSSNEYRQGRHPGAPAGPHRDRLLRQARLRAHLPAR
jgi:hypothetical protein